MSRGGMGIWRTGAVLAIGPAVLLTIVWGFGLSPLPVLRALLHSAAGNLDRFSATLLVFCPLLLASLAVCIAFRCGIWNIGVEGQYLMGALAATAVGVHAGSWPAALALPAALAAAITAGVGWAALAAWLKLARGVQEVLSTLLLNFVALQLVAVAVHGPLADPHSSTGDTSAVIAASSRLPLLAARGGLHAGILIGLAATMAVWLLLSRSVFGLRIRIVGGNPIAARFSGLAAGRYAWSSFLLSGALGGLAGGVEISGNSHYLTTGFGAGYGYTAVAVAMLARLSPPWIVPAALFVAALDVGVRGLQYADLAGADRLPSALTFVAQGAVMLAAAWAAGAPRRTGDT